MGEKIFMEIFLKNWNYTPIYKKIIFGKKLSDPNISQNVKKKILEKIMENWVIVLLLHFNKNMIYEKTN
jgi:hypothetical protein